MPAVAGAFLKRGSAIRITIAESATRAMNTKDVQIKSVASMSLLVPAKCAFLWILCVIATTTAGTDQMCADTSNHFFCSADNKCLSSAAVCNGVAECSSGEDERNCSHLQISKHTCEPQEFNCKDGKDFEKLRKQRTS